MLDTDLARDKHPIQMYLFSECRCSACGKTAGCMISKVGSKDGLFYCLLCGGQVLYQRRAAYDEIVTNLRLMIELPSCHPCPFRLERY